MNTRSLLIAAIAGFGFYWLLPRLAAARALAAMLFRRTRAHIVAEALLSPDERTLLHYHDPWLESLGFEYRGVLRSLSLLSRAEVQIATAQWQQRDAPVWCSVQIATGPEADRVVNISFDTRLQGGSRLCTARFQMESLALPPLYQTEGHPDYTPAQLLERHRARVAACQPGQCLAETTLEERCEQQQAEVTRYLELLRARKVTVATPDADLDRPSVIWLLRGADRAVRIARRRAAAARKQAPAHSVDDLVMRARADRIALEMQLREPRPGANHRFAQRWLFVFGAVLFWAVAALVWDPLFAAMLIGVLAFHEAGHALTMMKFGYRDVAVFFIPMLGALATAKPAAVSVMRRALVLLAGPMPGIVLALALVQLAPAWSSSRPGFELLLMLLFLNAFNLLPLGPLDGGQVVQLIAGEHRYAAVAVQGLGAAGMLALAWWLSSPLLAMMGLFVGWSIYARRPYLRFYAQAMARLKGDCSRDRIMDVVSQLTTEPAYARWRFGVRLTLCTSLEHMSQQRAGSLLERAGVLLLYLVCAALAAYAYLLLFQH